MGWVYMSLEGGEPVPFPDDPDVVAAQEARGYEVVEDAELTAPVPETVEPDEVDIHGQGWIYLEHPEVGGPARYPVEVADEMYAQGWTRPGAEDDTEEPSRTDAQAKLKELGLPATGTTEELLARLAEAEQDEDAPVESEETEEQ